MFESGAGDLCRALIVFNRIFGTIRSLTKD